MTPARRRLSVLVTAATALAVVAVSSPISARAGNIGSGAPATSFFTGRWVALNGSIAPLTHNAQKLRPLAASRTLGITVTLRVWNQATLSQYLTGLYDAGSPVYHHFLTPEEFAQQFAPSAGIRAGVVSWLRSQGLQVTGTSSNGLQVYARGSVTRLQRAFETPLYTYMAKKHSFFANAQAIRLPGNLAPNVVDVAGLSSATAQKSTFTSRPHQTGAPRGLSPSDLASIYDTAPLLAAGIDGAGQTIAIATFADYTTKDIATYDQQFGLSSSVTKIKVDGGASLGEKKGQDETEADIETVQAAAPKASILVYETPNSDTSNQTMIDVYNKIVTDNRAGVVTTSWGQPESTMPSDDLAALDQILQEAAAQGQAFFAASGDSGAYDNAGSGPGTDTQLAVDYPASDPWVTGVGGTTLNADSTQYVSETAWSAASKHVGSGGGLSDVYARPSYQAGPGVDNQYSDGKRQVPDVAANADPSTGYAAYTVDSNDNPGWEVGGGTSASTPYWAGFAALVDQALGKRVGFMNPVLYELGQKASSFAVSPFHDVTQGTNLYYPATPGWDFATGWGSFDGAAFVADIKTVPIPTLVPTATPTATPLPTSTPRPTATAVPPTVTITKVILLHTVNGKLQPTSTLKLGEKGTLITVYQKKHAASAKPGGTVLIRLKGQVISTLVLKTTTYQGKPALMATIHFTNKNRVGILQAHVTVTLGAAAVALDRTFKIAA